MRDFARNKSTKTPRRRSTGFTIIELMVSLGVFSVFLYTSSGFWGTMIHGTFKNQDLISDLQQTSRIALDFLGSELKQTGAGQLFTPQPPHSSPGYSIIPTSLSDPAVFGQTGAIPLVSSDGGDAGPDEITVVYGIQGRVARIESDDLDAGTLILDFQLRDDTQDVTTITNANPYPFFTGFFNPAQPSPFSPGFYGFDDPQDQTWINGMLLLKSAASAGSEAMGVTGQTGERAQYRVVRVTGVQPLAVTGNDRYFAQISYTEEPENPLNRWFKTIPALNGGKEILSMVDGMANPSTNARYEQRKALGGGVMCGCNRPCINYIGSDAYNACFTAMLVQMRTFFIAPPGHPANPNGTSPALAMIPYTQRPQPGQIASQAVVLVDGIEDMQVEYFFSRNGPGIGLATQDAQLNQGVHDLLVANNAVGYPGYWNALDRVPNLASLTGVRVSIRAGKYIDDTFFTSYDPIANRTDYSSVEVPGAPKLARITRVFVAFRNVDTPYRPKDQNPIKVKGI